MKKKYIKPETKKHGTIKDLTRGKYDGGSDANTGDSIPLPPDD
ncbi:MAG: hypothetical protein ACOX08_12115 [Methanobacterium sp.]